MVMSDTNPAVILYDALGNPLAVQAGAAVPLATPALITAGQSQVDGNAYRLDVSPAGVASVSIANPLGQQTMAGSVSVALASDQTPLSVTFPGTVAVTQSTSPWVTDGSGFVQPISAAALPLPAGAATEATLASRASEATLASRASEATLASRASEATLATRASELTLLSRASEATLLTRASASQLPAILVGGRLDGNLGAWLGSTSPTVGQKAMADSIPVVFASDQSALPVTGLVTGTVTLAERVTYSTASLIAVVNPATDIATLSGSASKIVKVTRITLNGEAAGGPIVEVFFVKRSSANTGGTSTPSFGVPYDSLSAAATAVLTNYTANPASLGTTVGNVRIIKTEFAAPGGTPPYIEIDFTVPGVQQLVLRGANEFLAINLNGFAQNNVGVTLSVEWTEE
jgi:hypothetical protein